VILLQERAAYVELNCDGVVEWIRDSHVAVGLGSNLNFTKVDILHGNDSWLHDVGLDWYFDLLKNRSRNCDFGVDFLNDFFVPLAVYQLGRKLNLEALVSPRSDVEYIQSG
jgi:hypothetical protein